jgi:ribosomal protein L7/L12
MSRCPYCDEERADDTPGECGRCGASLGPVLRPETAVPRIDDEIRDLVSQGRRIEAIARLRAATGASLSEAADLLDRVAYEGNPGPPDSPDPRYAALLRDGRKIEAIRLYRERSGASLRDAKQRVEALQQSLGIDTRGDASGLAGAVLAAFALAGAITGLVLWFFLS